MIKNIPVKNWLGRLAEYACLLYIVMLYLFADNAQFIQIANICFVIFAIFAILNIVNRGELVVGINFWIAALFVTFSFCSVLWAVNGDYVISKTTTMIQLFVFFVLMINTFYEEKKVDHILNAMLFAGLCLSVYSLYIYRFDTVLLSMVGGQRLGGVISQENTFGMLLATTVVLCAYYLIFEGKRVMIVLAILPFLMSISSGSRKAVIIILVGIIALFFVKYGFKKLHKFIIVAIVLLALSNYLIQLPMFYTINLRWEGMINMLNGSGVVEESAALRLSLIQQGLEWFKESPIIGHGLANFRVLSMNSFGIEVYAHNNFIELLVGLGIIGFAIYYSMYAYILIKLWPQARKKNTEVIAIYILLLIRLIMDYGSVSYDSKIVWVYLALGFIAVAKYGSKNKIALIRNT